MHLEQASHTPSGATAAALVHRAGRRIDDAKQQELPGNVKVEEMLMEMIAVDHFTNCTWLWNLCTRSGMAVCERQCWRKRGCYTAR